MQKIDNFILMLVLILIVIILSITLIALFKAGIFFFKFNILLGIFYVSILLLILSVSILTFRRNWRSFKDGKTNKKTIQKEKQI